jgi:serine/threonine protein kinase
LYLQDILDELGPTEGQTVLQLPENEARFIFGCLVTALEEVHSRGYTHHDVKAANFVRFYDGKYKLIDFDNTRLADKVRHVGTALPLAHVSAHMLHIRGLSLLQTLGAFQASCDTTLSETCFKVCIV